MPVSLSSSLGSFFFNDTATTEIYTLSLHDALPIWSDRPNEASLISNSNSFSRKSSESRRARATITFLFSTDRLKPDRKSTRLNSSHSQISYAVFCLKKKKKNPDLGW